jgi:bifunctional DNA-binding transcriptional regulator/antitoxin component of YhaV-PrlF toxin-antitoxin module
MNMPSEIRAALEAAHGGPVEIVDGDQHYVLIRAEVYERLKLLFDDSPMSDEERRGLLLQAGKRAGWDEPAMDIYNDLDPRRTS